MSEQVRQRAHVGSLGSLGFRRWLFASPKLLDQHLLRADDVSSISDQTSKHSKFRRLPRHNAAVERLQRGSMRVLQVVPAASLRTLAGQGELLCAGESTLLACLRNNKAIRETHGDRLYR